MTCRITGNCSLLTIAGTLAEKGKDMNSRFDALIEVLQNTLSDTTCDVTPTSPATASTESGTRDQVVKEESIVIEKTTAIKTEEEVPSTAPSTEKRVEAYQAVFRGSKSASYPCATQAGNYMSFVEPFKGEKGGVEAVQKQLSSPSAATSPEDQKDQPRASDAISQQSLPEVRSQHILLSNIRETVAFILYCIKLSPLAAERCWTAEADERLKKAVSLYGERQWKEIAQYVGDKSYVQCAQRWRNVLKSGIKKGHWSLEEDELLRKAYKETEGLRDSKRWTAVSEHVPGKTNKQCRERWNEHLRPEINKGIWTSDEDNLLLSLYSTLGSQWSKIANQMKGRTQNNVKSRWKTLNRHQTQKYAATQPPVLSPMPSTLPSGASNDISV